MNKKIDVNYENKFAYSIVFQKDFDSITEHLKSLDITNRKICIVTDSNVAPLYSKKLNDILKNQCNGVTVVSFEAGEASKNLETVQKIYNVLVMKKFDRNDLLLALGGGVVGDITGFVAATYMRGIDFIQVPTTLLAMVDSSVGGKTGVDLNQYKNIVGAFKMPKLVYININALKTLPERQFSAGMAEVIKYGLIMSKDFYSFLDKNSSNIMAMKPKELMSVVYMCCKFKQAVVEKDPLEKGLRKILNFGHTVGHSIEKLKNFDLLHGECVALGMIQALEFSSVYYDITGDDITNLFKLLKDYKLPVSTSNLKTDSIIEELGNDKKMNAGSINFVILSEIGHAKIKKIDLSDRESADFNNLSLSINKVIDEA